MLLAHLIMLSHINTPHLIELSKLGKQIDMTLYTSPDISNLISLPVCSTEVWMVNFNEITGMFTVH